MISVNTRIFAILDGFDALTPERPYKKAFPQDLAIGILQEGSESHFDPEILEQFEPIIEELHRDIRDIENEVRLSWLLDKHVDKRFTNNPNPLIFNAIPDRLFPTMVI